MVAISYLHPSVLKFEDFYCYFKDELLSYLSKPFFFFVKQGIAQWRSITELKMPEIWSSFFLHCLHMQLTR